MTPEQQTVANILAADKAERFAKAVAAELMNKLSTASLSDIVGVGNNGGATRPTVRRGRPPKATSAPKAGPTGRIRRSSMLW